MVNLGSSYGGGDENVDLNEASTVVLYLFLSQRMTSTDRAILILLKCPTNLYVQVGGGGRDQKQIINNNRSIIRYSLLQYFCQYCSGT